MDRTVLVNDGHAHLSLAKDVGLGKDTFGIVAVDDGGFTLVILTKESWEEMKKKVDDFLKELK